MTQPGLFDYEPQPLTPVTTPQGLGKPTYTRYKGMPTRCDDCTLRDLETFKAGLPMEPARLAHWRRTQRSAMPRLLCYEDKTLRETQEAGTEYDKPAASGRKRVMS